MTTPSEKSAARYAVTAGFLGWTLDAFDFFILTFVFAPIAKDFGTSISAVALTITASLATAIRLAPFIFGLYGGPLWPAPAADRQYCCSTR